MAIDPTITLILSALWKITGVILIPIVAVLTTLKYQDWQGQRKDRMQLLRMLLATRHMPSDPAYSTAINLVRVEFNDVPTVMAAWEKLMEAVTHRSSPENRAAHDTQITKTQTKLISAIMASLKLKHSEADLQTDAYAAIGFTDRDELYQDSLRAQRDHANAMRAVADVLAFQTRLLAGEGTPPVEEPPALPKN